jgi:hypothetical protein
MTKKDRQDDCNGLTLEEVEAIGCLGNTLDQLAAEAAASECALGALEESANGR